MKTILLSLILLLNLSISAQTFDEYIKKADDFYNNSKYQESANMFEKAFELQEGNAGLYYNAACSWALAGDTINSIKLLNKSIDKGWNSMDHLIKDKDLLSLHNTYGWQQVTERLQKIVDEIEKYYDKPLKNQLESIMVRDQTLRQLSPDAEKKFGKDSDNMKYFWKIISEQDSLNEIEVADIIDKYGWVGRSKVGNMANMVLWLVIQHAPLETQEKYLPLLKESVKNGESSGNHLALLEDRILMGQGKPQIYGSQIVTDDKTGKDVVYKMISPEYVNKRRQEVGLGPIEEYVKNWDIEWTVKQK